MSDQMEVPEVDPTFPYEINLVEENLNKELLKHFKGETIGYVQTGKEKWFFPNKFLQDAKHIYNFKVRPDDTWVISFPRSGTTMTQEIIWLLANDMQFEKAGLLNMRETFPFLESTMLLSDHTKEKWYEDVIEHPEFLPIWEKATHPKWTVLEKMESPRYIKTHMPFSLLPPTLLTSGCKIVYIARNCKDVAVSYYHLCRTLRSQGFDGDFKTFWEFFRNNNVYPAPYFSHVKEAFELRNHPNVLFLQFEKITKNKINAIKQVSEFLGKPYSAEKIKALAEYLDIENAKKRGSDYTKLLQKAGSFKSGEQGFIRRGATGGWLYEFNMEMQIRADEWISENLKDTDLKF